MKTLRKHKISGVPVFRRKKFVGEISKTDILKIVGKTSLEEIGRNDLKILEKIKVSKVMKKPICVKENELLENAIKKMEKHGISRLFVLDKKRSLIGIITKTDLMKSLSKRKIQEKISTKIDELLELLEKGCGDMGELARKLGVSEELVENWVKTLEEFELVEVKYPVVGKPIVCLKKKEE